MMNFSDETVERVRKAIDRSLQNARIYNTIGEAYTPEAKAALSSLTLADLMPWQPIETAPKDGTEIILGGYVNGDWMCMNDRWYQDRVMGAFDDWGLIHEIPPTHWMPLPNPPTEPKQ